MALVLGLIVNFLLGELSKLASVKLKVFLFPTSILFFPQTLDDTPYSSHLQMVESDMLSGEKRRF